MSGRQPWLSLAVLAVLAGAAAGAVILLGSTDKRAATLDPEAEAAFEARTGVRIVRVAVTGGGGLIDFRYQVVDPDKAVVVHDRSRRAALVEERSGEVLDGVWGHQSHRSRLEGGRTYYLLFVNRAGLIRPDGLVSVRLGESLLEHVVAQ